MTGCVDGAANPDRPKLIEVGMPLDVISAEAAREKSIRHGHPSTLHMWWARRPLAACRAVLFAQLVDDPSAHPEKFDTKEKQDAERKKLHGIISELVKWENIHNERLLEKARAKIQESCNGSPPPILDPFAGGGSIPLEAQRLGLDACARDLNPVAVLITKALIEIPPKWAGRPPVFPGAAGEAMAWPRATGLAEDVLRYGRWMQNEAKRRVGGFYPKVTVGGTETTVIAWIWARTVTCPNPACRGTMPLARSFWLGRKMGKERYVVPVPAGNRILFKIGGPDGVPAEGTVSRTGAVCLLCHSSAPLSYLRAEGRAGRMGAQLMTIAAEGVRQRRYLPPSEEHVNAAVVPRPDDAPAAEIPHNPRYLTTPNYGLRTWGDLFTNRQLAALTTFCDLVNEGRAKVLADTGDPEYADAIATYLALIVSRIIDRNSAVTTWDAHQSKEQLRGVFARQAIPMTWDFAEGNPFSRSSGNLEESIEFVVECLKNVPASPQATVMMEDAALGGTEGRLLVATDPPYYDNIGYADLSDFYYVWLRRMLHDVHPDLMNTMLTPKQDEIVADPIRHGSLDLAMKFYEERFQMAFQRICDNTPDGYPISFFYSYKQSETEQDGNVSTAWEILLNRLLSAGWTVTGAWPIRTELSNRLRGRDSNALASSVVLTCRPRPDDAPVTDRRGLISALRSAMPDAVQTLEASRLAPGDLRQAMIGPGMKVYSGYARVNEPNGEPLRVRSALKLINQVFDEFLSRLEGDINADTRWCLEWYRQHGFDPAPHDEAAKLARATNTDVEALRRAGVVQAARGKVKLLPVEEIKDNYDPASDSRASEWKICLHIAKLLKDQGTGPAARLMAVARGLVDMESVRNVANMLYTVADMENWAQTAALFSALVTSWPDLDGDSKKLPASSLADAQERLWSE